MGWGEERKGKERKGKERKGKERKGNEEANVMWCSDSYLGNYWVWCCWCPAEQEEECVWTETLDGISVAVYEGVLPWKAKVQIGAGAGAAVKECFVGLWDGVHNADSNLSCTTANPSHLPVESNEQCIPVWSVEIGSDGEEFFPHIVWCKFACALELVVWLQMVGCLSLRKLLWNRFDRSDIVTRVKRVVPAVCCLGPAAICQSLWYHRHPTG